MIFKSLHPVLSFNKSQLVDNQLIFVMTQMCIRMDNSEAVAHTPQPHIGEAYVGITRSISTMYRGAVPITEHQSADVLEKLRQKSKEQNFPTLSPVLYAEASLGSTC